jgi:hypothetical protein
MANLKPTFGRFEGGADRRVETRRPAALRGRLVVGPQFAFDCVIRNLSDGGARIDLPFAVPPLDQAWLLDISGAVAWRCAAVWRNQAELGLKFLDRHDLKRPTIATPGHLRKLWLDAGGR